MSTLFERVMNTLYIHPCIVCGERTGFDTDKQGSCGPCTPHVCVPEAIGDDWCDICGEDI